MKVIGNFIADVIANPSDEKKLDGIAREVRQLCDRFPAPGLQL